MLIALMTLAIACGGSDTKKDEQPTEQTEQEFTEAMGEEHKDDSPEASPQAKQDASADVETTKITYHKAGDREVKGFLSKPKGAEGNLPGIIVIHEWWGLNNNIKSMSEQLAAQGYVTLAVDLYEGRVADAPDKAKEYMTAAMENPDAVKQNLRSAYATLMKQGATKIGVIGWCFGGAWSLQMGLMFPQKLDAMVIYYGRLVQDKEQLATLEMPILGIFGAEDAGIPVTGVKQFEKTLKELGKDADIRIYGGAGHAFANPSGENYVEEAAEDAWSRTTAFFAEHLKGEAPAGDAPAADEAGSAEEGM
jgi:carboxymethylenebutenolidase